MIIYLRRHLNSLVPSDSLQLDLLKSIGRDETVKCKITKPRNLKHHKKYWAMVNMIFENFPHQLEPLFKTANDLHHEFKLQCGMFDTHTTLGGKETIKVRSIKFEAMDQTAFEEYYEQCLHVVAKYIMPGITAEEIRNQILEF